MKKKAYLGIDIGSISTKGVIINDKNEFLAECYLWTEGNPTKATKEVLHSLQEQFDAQEYEIVSSGKCEKTGGEHDRGSGGKK